MTESGVNRSSFSGANPFLSWAARSAGVPVDLARNEVVTARPNPGPRLCAHSRHNGNQLTGDPGQASDPGPQHEQSLLAGNTACDETLLYSASSLVPHEGMFAYRGIG
jgi:hypothetical protein